MDGDLFGELHAKRMDRRNTTAAAASRQKSCNACVRGKRRCDKTMPRCTRCAAKGLDCVYQKLPPMPSHSSPSSSASSGAPHAATTSVGAPQDPCPDMSTDFDMGGFDMNACDLGVGGTGGTVTSPETLQLDPSLDFHIADLIGSGSHHTSSLWNIPGFAEPKTDFPAPVPMPPPPCDQPRQPIRDLAVLDENSLDNCVVADPLLVHDPRSRIGHIVGYLTNLHVDFAQSRTLPFIHPRLYAAHLPRTMMSAFCAATAYANRTPATKGWALRLLSDAARDIQNEGRSGPQSPVDKVARVQALCLVDTMRIFDGDIALRHAAEKERPLLKEWVKELVKLREELEGEADAPIKASRDRPPKSWDVSFQFFRGFKCKG